MSILSEISDALASAVAKAADSVARVEARDRFPASGIVWSTNGVIVTAHHVVDRDERIKVGVGPESMPASVVGRDPATDIAVLQAEAQGLTPIAWANSGSLKVGHITLALGRPGKTVRATMGIASAIGGPWQGPGGGRFDRYLQADVAMHPGFSGGPLIDATGAAHGMNTSALIRAATPTVPAVDIKRVTEAILTHGHVRRGYLGVTPQPVRLPEELAQELGQENGLMLTVVESGSPADRAGLMLGDVIVQIDDARLRHLDDLFGALADGADRQVTIRAIRGGQVRDFAATIGERG